MRRLTDWLSRRIFLQPTGVVWRHLESLDWKLWFWDTRPASYCSRFWHCCPRPWICGPRVVGHRPKSVRIRCLLIYTIASPDHDPPLNIVFWTSWILLAYISFQFVGSPGRNCETKHCSGLICCRYNRTRRVGPRVNGAFWQTSTEEKKNVTLHSGMILRALEVW